MLCHKQILGSKTFIGLINSYRIKDYKEALQSQVSRDLGRHWPVYSPTKIVSKYGLFSLYRITKYLQIVCARHILWNLAQLEWRNRDL